MSPMLRRLLSIFPVKPSFAFGYGSRVKVQANECNKSDMIDIVIAVDDPVTFHSENLELNRDHYSSLRSFGPRIVSSVQQHFGAKVYYNTLIPVTIDGDHMMIKYGVIKTKDLVDDLLDWDTLYLSGRLHKPVQVMQPPESDTLTTAMKINHQNALHAALLLLDESFSEESLYLTIGNLSYSGDFRMIFGENKNKVRNIVLPQISQFRSLYQPYLSSPGFASVVQFNGSSGVFTQDLSPQVIVHHLNLLPKQVQTQLYIKWKKQGTSHDVEDVMQHLSHRPNIQAKVREAIDNIVWFSSWTQSLKGIVTAGAIKSVTYAKSKVVKMYQGNKEKNGHIK